MSETAVLEAISACYDAALVPGQWQDTIKRIARIFDRPDAEIQYIDYESLEFKSLAHFGFDPEDLNSKPEFADWPQHDPWAAAGALQQAEDIVIGTNLLSADQYRNSVFHNDYGRTVGWEWRDVLCTFFERSGDKIGALCIYSQWPQEDFSNQDAQTIALLRPHLVKALELHDRLSEINSKASFHVQLLDRLPHGIVLLNSNQRVIFHNKMIETLVQSGSLLTIAHSKLRLHGEKQNEALQAAIANTARLRDQATLCGNGAFEAYDHPNSKSYTILAVPVWREDAAAVSFMSDMKPHILILVSDRNPKLRRQVNIIGQMYNLTPSEARVTECLSEGATLNEIAEASGNSVHTIRSQVKAIFSKTEMHSQVELVKLILTTAI